MRAMPQAHRLKPVPPVLLCTLTVLLSACTVGPNYKRPSVPAPGQYRGGPAPSQASLADTKWPDLFPDEALKQLIAAALAHNFDLAMASERVEEARARYRIAGANQYPFVYADEQAGTVRYSTIGSSLQGAPGTPTEATYTQTGLALSWELDLWGRIRRLKESARAQYLATEEARRGVIVSLIGDVAGNYFTLRERDLELQIARNTRDIADRNLRLITLRHDHGAATGLDVHQAEQFLYLATVRIASVESDIGPGGKCVEPAAWESSRRYRAGQADRELRPAAAASGRIAVFADRPPARHPRGRAESDFRQCADRRGEGVLLPADYAYRPSGRAEPGAHPVVHRSGAPIGPCLPTRSCPSSPPARFAWPCASRKRRSARC